MLPRGVFHRKVFKGETRLNMQGETVNWGKLGFSNTDVELLNLDKEKQIKSAIKKFPLRFL